MLGPLESLIRLHELTVDKPDVKNRRRMRAEVDRCKLELPPEIVDRHEYLVGRYGKSALVPIKGGCCTGCYISVPSSRESLEEGLYACEQCGRLLFDESKVFDLIHA